MLKAIKSKHYIETKRFISSYAEDFNKAFSRSVKHSKIDHQLEKDQENHIKNFSGSKLKREDFLMFKMHQDILKRLPLNKDIHISNLVDVKSENNSNHG